MQLDRLTASGRGSAAPRPTSAMNFAAAGARPTLPGRTSSVAHMSKRVPPYAAGAPNGPWLVARDEPLESIAAIESIEPHARSCAMPRVVLAPALRRWLPGEGELSFEVDAADVRGALELVFAQHPALRGYVLDEAGTVRHHVALFVDGQALRDKTDLSQTLPGRGELYVMQALSGG